MLAGKYRVDALLGSGWEGEAYRVTETLTGVQRAAKIFYPHRNLGDRALRRYARKLEILSDCPVLIRYHHSDSFRHRGHTVSFLLSELVHGEILEDLVQRQRGKRLAPFEALHLLRTIAEGVRDIHRHREYHGDIHDRNVLVRRRGVHFDVKVLDLFSHGSYTRERRRDDVIDLVHLLHGMVGGAKHYGRQPQPVKEICRGLKRTLILQRFPTVERLLEHLDGFRWP